VIYPAEGRFIVTIGDERTIPYSFPVWYMLYQYPIRRDVLITAPLPPDKYRIVLSWGSTPADLDSHLIGCLDTGSDEFHISYRNMRIYQDRAVLDIDAVKGYGPETITMREISSGRYIYCVHDFTNRRASSSSLLAGSTAEVRVYQGAALLHVIQVPHLEGTLWRVLEIDGKARTVRIINEMSYQSDPVLVR